MNREFSIKANMKTDFSRIQVQLKADFSRALIICPEQPGDH